MTTTPSRSLRALNLVVAAAVLATALPAQEAPGTAPATLLAAPANPAATAAKEKLERRTAALKKRVEAEAAKLTDDGKGLEDDSKKPFVFDMTVRWVDREFSFDLPSVNTRTQKMSLDLPQVKMHPQRIVFHTPSVRMETRDVGFGIKIDVPVPFMQEQEIKFDLPEISWGRTEFSMDIPEFRMERASFKLSVPEVVVKEFHFVIPIDKSDMTERADTLKQRGAALEGSAKAEANAMVRDYLAEVANASSTPAATASITNLKAQRDKVIASFNAGIASIDQSLAAGGAHVPPATVQQLTATRAQLVAQRDAAAAQLDALIAQATQPLPTGKS